MPPRALMEPETGNSLSSFTISRPGSAASSSVFMCGISRSGDSSSPPVARVSGNAAQKYGAKRASRAAASSMSVRVSGHATRAASMGWRFGLTQSVSSMRMSCPTMGYSACHCAAVFPAMMCSMQPASLRGMTKSYRTGARLSSSTQQNHPTEIHIQNARPPTGSGESKRNYFSEAVSASMLMTCLPS